MKKVKNSILYALILLAHYAVAQDYERVDASIELYPNSFNSVEELSSFISRDFTSEEDKVRAIYTWIITNVAYDPEEYKNYDFSFKNYRERNLKEEKAREKIIKRTIKKGVAVCEGYAMLFEKLCELQGITTYLVRGDTKSNFNDIGRDFNTNHMWNVAVIDGQSYLFDPTWGAGKFNGVFIKEPSYFYYKTPPDLFFRSHYPTVYEDAFMEQVIPQNVFSNLPLIIDLELSFNDIELPLSGVVRSDGSEKTTFKLRRKLPNEITYAFDEDKVRPVNVLNEDGLLNFEVPMELGKERLLIYFDGEPALGFKVD